MRKRHISETVASAEAQGIQLRVHAGRLKARLPTDNPSTATLVKELRTWREEVIDFLQQRALPLKMPEGISLRNWNPKRPPVILRRYSVANDIPLFVACTLKELERALLGTKKLNINWSVAELLDRLHQVGADVSIERPRSGG